MYLHWLAPLGHEWSVYEEGWLHAPSAHWRSGRWYQDESPHEPDHLHAHGASLSKSGCAAGPAPPPRPSPLADPPGAAPAQAALLAADLSWAQLQALSALRSRIERTPSDWRLCDLIGPAAHVPEWRLRFWRWLVQHGRLADDLAPAADNELRPPPQRRTAVLWTLAGRWWLRWWLRWRLQG